LQAAGLRTLAVVDGGISEYLRPANGFAVGFDRYASLPGGVRWPTTGGHVAQALAMLEEEHPERYFMWIHLFDPHRAERQRDAYDRLLAATDEGLGALIDGIRARGRWDRTVFVLTADHGEAFGEHGNYGHGSSLYDEQVRVPLIVRIPGAEPGVVTDPASAIDIAPTLASLAGAPLTGMTGVNLAPLVLGDAHRYPRDRVVFSEHLFYGPHTQRRLVDLKMALSGDEKLVWDRRAEALELYDLSEDPAEESSVLWERTETAQSMRQLLQSWADDAEAKHPLP
jgi:arylsulfatase A-like enzyme